MSITRERKDELMNEFATVKSDTGSPEVQSAILTERIKNLTKHMKENHKDYSSRRGLLVLVGRRTALLRHLKIKSLDRYVNLIKKLGLRK